jgi:hypothetical protein
MAPLQSGVLSAFLFRGGGIREFALLMWVDVTCELSELHAVWFEVSGV